MASDEAELSPGLVGQENAYFVNDHTLLMVKRSWRGPDRIGQTGQYSELLLLLLLTPALSFQSCGNTTHMMLARPSQAEQTP